MLVAMEGSVGYGIGSARVELEIGYERFKTKGIRDSGSKEDEADTVYLLAKELAYDVVNSQEKSLGDALAKTSGKDIVKFAEALGISYSEIDKKVCNKGYAAVGTAEGKKYAKVPDDSGSAGKTAQCSGLNSGSAEGEHKSLSKFVSLTGVNEGENWPMGSGANSSGKVLVKGNANSNAEAVAKDLTKNLSHDEKIKVAGLLARTIEGGEVVEIRAVSSTSVMVNACYDLLSEGLGVVPYACVGLGGNFVGVVDGHITPKLAYRLKAGLSYQLSPEISAFAGGFYHRVVGAVSARRY
ncbi:Major surface antigen 4 precursor [Anaplasma phagocytophilum]|nr:Major surface antigen 4 precursor [Anaplasma phagocytophilum]